MRGPRLDRGAAYISVLGVALVLVLAGTGRAAIAIGDTLTVIQRPLLNIPVIVTVGDTIEIQCDADPAASGWQARECHAWRILR